MRLPEIAERIKQIDGQLAVIPPGRIVYRIADGVSRPFREWTENGDVHSVPVGEQELDEAVIRAGHRKDLLSELKRLRALLIKQSEMAGYELPEFSTSVVRGEGLESLVAPVKHLKRRDCYRQLQRYLAGDLRGRVCILYGLRRTGKTTMLFQALADMSPEERSHAVYIKLRSVDTMSELNRDLRRLQSQGVRYVLLDEITLVQDFIDDAAVLSDLFAMMGMKILLSGTDSLGFWLSLKQELYDRALMVHTTYIPFSEYYRLIGLRSVDDYIRYGGTLRAGDSLLDEREAFLQEPQFRDDESTRRYVDTAICQNIQNSLAHCRDGRYFRHLWQMYEAKELTRAINRLIENINHRFVLSTVTAPFKSHDLGPARQLLERQTDILSRIDSEQISRRLMEILQIRDREELKVGLESVHILEIKEYLKALDLIVDCPRRFLDGEPSEYVIFTQPGMRFCQAEALVHALIRDPVFSAASEQERNLATEKILEDVMGKMLEDIVLYETVRTLPRDRKAFKLILSRGEFDMVIYSSSQNSCELYEIKHSSEISPHQYHVLEDEEQCARVVQIFGPITRRCVFYRGGNRELPNGIVYRNVEEYLLSLGEG